MSLASRALSFLNRQYELVFKRMRLGTWLEEFGPLLAVCTQARAPQRQRRKSQVQHRMQLEQFEPRLMMSTTLYWDTNGSTAGLGGTGTWNTTATNWTTDSTGSSATQAWVSGSDAVFAGTVGTVTLGAGMSASTLTFNTSGYSVASNTVTLTGGTVDVASGATATISSVVAGSAGLTKTDAGTLILSATNTYSNGTTISAGTLQIGSGSSSGTLGSGDVTDNASLVFMRSNSFTVSNSLSGSGTVTQSGGTVTLSGSNSFSGGLMVNSGTLILGNDSALGTGTLTLANGTTLQTSATRTINDAVVLNGNITLSGSYGLTLAGTVDLGSATRTVTVSGTVAPTISGVIGGTGGLTKSGNTTLILTGTNTYTGTTSLSAGTLQLGDGATSNGSIAGAVSYSSGSATLAFANPFDQTFSTSIGGSNGYMTKSGAGTLILSGANSQRINVINGGTLQVGNTQALGVGYASVTVNNGTVDLHGFNVTAGSPAGTGTITNNGATTATYSIFTSTGNTTFSGTLSDGTATLALTKTGAGATTLAGTNTATGLTSITGGTLQLGNGSTSNGSLGSSAISVSTGTTLIFANPNAQTCSATISGAGNVIKNAAGALTLSAAEAYTGTTTVNAGALLVDGSLNPASAVSLASGTTLGGTGTVAGPITAASGASIAPGDPVTGTSILTTYDLNLAAGSTFNVQFNSTTAGTGYDQLNSAGAVNLNGSQLSISGDITGTYGDKLVLINNDYADPVSGTFANLPEGAFVTLNGKNYQITYQGGTGNDVVLTCTSAPLASYNFADSGNTITDNTGHGYNGTLSSGVSFATTGTPTGSGRCQWHTDGHGVLDRFSSRD